VKRADSTNIPDMNAVIWHQVTVGARGPNSPELEGRAWFEMGKYDRAIADYTKAIALSHHGHDDAEDNLRRLGVTP
jgi:hypothetical protein